MKLALAAFTQKGVKVAQEIKEKLSAGGHFCQVYAPARFCPPQALEIRGSLPEWAGSVFDRDGLLFVGAAGIAVRAVAPHLRGKELDPAVVSVDEHGSYVIPLLSGHLGGANRLAREVAECIGATAVISTATDLNRVFPVDSWAVSQGLWVSDPAMIKEISAALLEGTTVGFCSAFPIDGPLPEGLIRAEKGSLGVCIDDDPRRRPFDKTMTLVPKRLVAGIGCRKGTGVDQLEEMLLRALKEAGQEAGALAGIASIDLKEQEPGLLALCQKYRLPLRCYSTEQLMSVPGRFHPSELVSRVTGADNVCQRAALAEGGHLVLPKQKWRDCTISLARLDWRGRFDS